MHCLELTKTVDDIESACLNSPSCTEDERADLLYTVGEPTTAIDAWKPHQLQSVHQDKARHLVVEKVAEQSVLVVQDWAMKFLPCKYHEGQCDWFAKRGISWHISVAIRKPGSEKALLISDVCAYFSEVCTRQCYHFCHNEEHHVDTERRNPCPPESVLQAR